jgi:hypothetical protein
MGKAPRPKTDCPPVVLIPGLDANGNILIAVYLVLKWFGDENSVRSPSNVRPKFIRGSIGRFDPDIDFVAAWDPEINILPSRIADPERNNEVLCRHQVALVMDSRVTLVSSRHDEYTSWTTDISNLVLERGCTVMWPEVSTET